jgi:hypothetical protein
MIPLRTSPDSRSRLAADTPTHALNAKNSNGNPYRAMLLIDGRAWRTSRPWMKDTPPNTVSNQAPAPPVATRTSPQTKRTPPTIVSTRAAQRSYLSPRSGFNLTGPTPRAPTSHQGWRALGAVARTLHRF